MAENLFGSDALKGFGIGQGAGGGPGQDGSMRDGGGDGRRMGGGLPPTSGARVPTTRSGDANIRQPEPGVPYGFDADPALLRTRARYNQAVGNARSRARTDAKKEALEFGDPNVARALGFSDAVQSLAAGNRLLHAGTDQR